MPIEEIKVTTLDGNEMPAVIAWPEGGGRLPAAVVLGELFGLTDVQRDATERVAAMGYVAIGPHLIHRHSPTPLPEDDDGRRQGLELVRTLSRIELLSDARSALAVSQAHRHCDSDAPAVAVGMSFGGHVAVLATALLGLRACVAMYAGWLADTTIAASRPQATGSLPLGGRLLVLAGESDAMVPASDLEALRGWHPDAEIVTYPAVGHRFCSINRPGYDADAAADAWARTARFLS